MNIIAHFTFRLRNNLGTTVAIVCLWVFVFSSPHLFAQEKSEDFIAILKTTGPYDRTEKQTFPAFTYQSASDPYLTALRKKYSLDSVAGEGDDVTRAIRLLNWMHHAVPHEDVLTLAVLNADNIISTYKEKHIAQGCYPLSISMNEIYLCMGFKSRTVICFSEGYAKRDGGHVINVVYINSLKKWLWMDPENNAYLMDEKGNYLSVADVRLRLVQGLPLVLSKTADYHGNPVTKEHYLYHFMAEHIYRIICPLNSAYNSQTRVPGKVFPYVELLPLQSYEPPMDKFETQQSSNYQVINYHTNNDSLFWQSP